MSNSLPDAKSIFGQALEIAATDDRERYLDQACCGHTGLRAEVNGLLQAHQAASGFMAAPAAGLEVTATAPAISEGPGTRIGRYKLLQEIGQGAFGVVFMAEQQEPVRRMVAIKVIKPGMDTRAVVARFDAERHALALMEHPNIAQVFDGGETDSGRPYFVMELVKGVPITRFCDRNHSSTEERLRLFVDVCRAVQHAHQKGIIHRDLKPSNIMVTLRDGVPVAKVIDFGVAKAINQRLTERTLYTSYNQMVGTPLYMSPEQAEMSALDVDTRSDIYSLGVLLYELLTGCTPLEAAALRAAAFAEMQRMIRETEPLRPSVRLSSSGQQLTDIARHRSIDPKGLRRLVTGELDWIVMKALEKDRRRRYETATAFAADVERFLRKEPVEAGPPTAAYRLRKFVARRKGVFATLTAVATALVLGFILMTRMWISVDRARQVAEIEKTRAKEERARADEARCIAESSERRAARQLYGARMYCAERALDRNNLPLLEALLAPYRSSNGEANQRGWEWYYLWRCWRRNQALSSDSLPGDVFRCHISNDGRTVVTASPYGACGAIWDVSDAPAKKIRVFGTEDPHTWQNQTFAVVSKSADVLAYPDPTYTRLILEDCRSGSQLRTIAFSEDVKLTAADSSHLRNLIAVGTADGRVGTIEVTTGNVVHVHALHHAAVRAIKFFTNQELVASGDAVGEIVVWNEATGEVRQRLSAHRDAIWDLSISPDGNLVASGSSDKTAIVWDWTSSAKPRNVFDTFRDEVRSVTFSPDGSLFAAGGREGLLRLWDTRTFEEFEAVRGVGGTPVAFLEDGRLTYKIPSTASLLGTQVICRVGRSDSDRVYAANKVTSVALGGKADHIILAACEKPGTKVRRWRVENDQLTELEHLPLDFRVGCLAASCDGTWVLGDAEHDVVRVCTDLESATQQDLLTANAGGTQCAAFSRNGSELAVGFRDGRIAVWVRDTEMRWSMASTWRAHEGAVRALDFDPVSTNTVVSGGNDRMVCTWDWPSCASLRPPLSYQQAVFSVAISPSGEKLAVTSFSRNIDIWHRRNGTREQLCGHTGYVSRVSFLDEASLLSTSVDRSVKIWDLPTQRERLTLDGGAEMFEDMAVCPDLSIVATRTRDGKIRLFRRATESDVRAAGW